MVLAVALGSGCSFVGVERLRGGYRPEEVPECSQTLLPVGADALYALLSASVTAALLIHPKWESDRQVGYLYLGLAATTAGSALYGWREANRCGRARADHRTWLATRARP